MFAYAVENTNNFPIFFQARRINGVFKIITSKPKFHFVIWLKIIEIPITPPSITAFGTKKASNANPAIIAPIVMKNKFLTSFGIKSFFEISDFAAMLFPVFIDCN